MDKRKMKKLLILNLPYFLVGLFATNLGEAWRLAEGADSSAKILSFFHALPIALNNPFPSFHPLDLLIGIFCGAGLRLAVYLKGKNAKKYRHNVEYGSARWGTAKDIEPFIAPKFEDNVILTKTERLMMSNRPKNPANARNKNVLIIGGSGSGKTRFWLKPNLLQMHSSYVVTDPKGSIVIECGNALLKHGYTIKIFNTINFQKSIPVPNFWWQPKRILKRQTARNSVRELPPVTMMQSLSVTVSLKKSLFLRNVRSASCVNRLMRLRERLQNSNIRTARISPSNRWRKRENPCKPDWINFSLLTERMMLLPLNSWALIGCL